MAGEFPVKVATHKMLLNSSQEDLCQQSTCSFFVRLVANIFGTSLSSKYAKNRRDDDTIDVHPATNYRTMGHLQ
jgi:hypothetical protein